MTHDGQVERGCQTRRAAADDRDFLAGGGLAFGNIAFAVEIHVSGEGFQLSDIDRLLNVLAAARLLARMRANSADRSGERDLVFDELEGGVILAVGNQSDVALTVGARRAVELTRSDAVAVVSGHQEFHCDLAGADNALRFGVDDHALGAFCGTGAQQLRDALGFDDTQSAGAVDLDRLVIAQGGDVDAVCARGF